MNNLFDKIILGECIIVSKEIGDKYILAKNRDRAYNPQLEVIHTIIDNVEVVYLHDIITDWSEGMNEFGIGVVNTALMVGFDEEEKKIVKKKGKPSKDGAKIRKALGSSNLKEAIRYAVQYEGGIKGHTFISSPKTTVSIETTSKHNPKINLVNREHPMVRTNHGHYYTDAGYTDGPDYKSSIVRKISAEKQMDKADDWNLIAPLMRNNFYKDDSPLNMKRDTKKMSTSSQLVLNLTDKIFQLSYFENKVESFEGIKVNLPKGYTPKIKIEVKKIS